MRGLWALVLLLGAIDARAAPPVVAVFELRDADARLTPEQRTQLTRYLRVRLTEHGGYPVVPEAELKQALRMEQAESFSSCYDEACQIEIGREVAAQKSLALELVGTAEACILTATFFDLVQATSERAASARSSCDAQALTVAIDVLVARLAPVTPTTAEARPAPPPSEAEVRITTYEPERAFDVTVYGAGVPPKLCTPQLSAADVCRLGLDRLGAVQVSVRDADYGVAELQLELDDAHRLAAVDVSLGYSLGGYLWMLSGVTLSLAGLSSLFVGMATAGDTESDAGPFFLINGAVFTSLGIGSLLAGLLWPKEVRLEEHLLP